MNVISLGSQCLTAESLTVIGLRKVALPFDWVNTPLPSAVKVLKRLKCPNFNMQELLKEFFSVKTVDNTENILGFNVSHFHSQQWKGWIHRLDISVGIYTPLETSISEQEHLKFKSMYRLNDEYSLTAHPEVYKMFERRFNRLKDMFFTQENILIYNDILISETLANQWEPFIKELMLLNPLNRLIYITYANRQLLLPLVDRVEVHRLDKRCKQEKCNPHKQAVMCKIRSIFTDVS